MSYCPSVSVVTPTYNSEKVLHMCLESIKGQDYPEGKLEIIIADGGSGDKTLDIAERYVVEVIEDAVEKSYLMSVHKYEHMFTGMNEFGLFDKRARRVIHLLALNPFEKFYQREISRLTDVSVGFVNRILKNFEEFELVVKEKRGRTILYKYNLDNPLAREIKKTFNLLETDGLVKDLRKISKKLILFGSCADGTDTKDSDIDILLITDDRMIAREIIKNYSGRRVSPIILNFGEFLKLKSEDRALYERINKGVVLWTRAEG